MFFVTPNKQRVDYLENAFEADVLRQVLADNQIPALIQANDSNAYGELFQSQQGWGAVYADEQYHQQIRQLLQEIRQTPPLPVDDEEGSL